MASFIKFGGMTPFLVLVLINSLYFFSFFYRLRQNPIHIRIRSTPRSSWDIGHIRDTKDAMAFCNGTLYILESNSTSSLNTSCSKSYEYDS